jgi:hypothetical protein
MEMCTGSSVFICEVPVHHAVVLRYDRANDSHSHYEFFREYFKGSNESVQKRIEASIVHREVCCKHRLGDDAFEHLLQLLHEDIAGMHC